MTPAGAGLAETGDQRLLEYQDIRQRSWTLDPILSYNHTSCSLFIQLLFPLASCHGTQYRRSAGLTKPHPLFIPAKLPYLFTVLPRCRQNQLVRIMVRIL